MVLDPEMDLSRDSVGKVGDRVQYRITTPTDSTVELMLAERVMSLNFESHEAWEEFRDVLQTARAKQAILQRYENTSPATFIRLDGFVR